MKGLRVRPGEKVRLRDRNASATPGFTGGKTEGLTAARKLTSKLDALQELLYAEHRHKVLVILQAMDTGGKDGTIRRVFEGVNPQGVRVASFKVPTPIELDHDYLWRAHAVAPAKGEIVIFNRSHYEDVLVVRVHELVPPEVWKKRFEQINDFERMLAQEGTTILKFFLHISPAEQKQRLKARLSDPAKHWKYNPGDLKERALWKKYMTAYEDVLRKTSTEYAPWFVVPADRKWYRDWVIAQTLIQTLERLQMKFPKPAFDLKAARAELEKLPDDA
jgi:PPK2 family polyphosphate:nucleotide phosphotransferase